MSVITREVNRCNQCTHEWIPQPGVLYTHCTSSKCRSRRWNKPKAADVAASVSVEASASVVVASELPERVVEYEEQP